MQNYREGDKVFLYGFSRGAYSVRVLAGMVRKVGLLYPDNQNMLDEAYRLFTIKTTNRESAGFKKSFSRKCEIHFLGLWDTVSSVGSIWAPKSFAYTSKNKGVSIVRHAMALDERRAFFRQHLWNEDQIYKHQNIKQVWFSGVHSDVGGGYKEEESGLAKEALQWMLIESQEHNLLFDIVKANKIINTHTKKPSYYKMHNSYFAGAIMTVIWVTAEFIPKVISAQSPILTTIFRKKWVKWLRINFFRRRYLKEPVKVIIFATLADRINNSNGRYKPSNIEYSSQINDKKQLDGTYKIEPKLSLEYQNQ